jgi:hypothetical protein
MNVKACEKNRFSKYVRKKDSRDFADLLTWKAWFLSRGIACAIHYVSGFGYAVFRTGLISVDDEEVGNAA